MKHKDPSQAPATEAATALLSDHFTFLLEKFCPPPVINADDSVVINCTTGEEGGK